MTRALAAALARAFSRSRFEVAMLLALLSTGAQALPSTFGTVIGSALLCRSHLENTYFHQYLTTAFGPAYKREGGAFWFKLDASLWGKSVKEVMVSDDTSELVFIGAVLEGKPEELEEAIHASAGLRHKARDGSAAPLRISNPGSVIAYQNGKSKIYCARYKTLPPGRQFAD